MNINFIRKCSQKIILNQKLNLDKNVNIFSRQYSSESIFFLSKQNLTSNDRYKNDKNTLFKNKITVNNISKRGYCNTEGPPVRRLPPLMKFPEIVWPSLFKSLRNFILTHFIIKPYFDREFNLPDFVSGTKKAVEVS